MKKGYILFYTLVLLMVVGILMSMIHFLTQTETSWWGHFQSDQKQLLIDYSLKKKDIHLSSPVTLTDGYGKIFIVK